MAISSTSILRINTFIRKHYNDGTIELVNQNENGCDSIIFTVEKETPLLSLIEMATDSFIELNISIDVNIATEEDLTVITFSKK